MGRKETVVLQGVRRGVTDGGSDGIEETDAAAAVAPAGFAHPKPGTRFVASDQWFAVGTQVIVDHGGDRYRLRRTSKGKLLLTK